MRRPPLKAKRDAIEPDVIKVILAHGISVYSLDTPCDLLCGYAGKTYLVEVKTGPKAKLTKAQKEFLKDWTGQYRIIRSVDEAIEWAARIRRNGAVELRGTIGEKE